MEIEVILYCVCCSLHCKKQDFYLSIFNYITKTQTHSLFQDCERVSVKNVHAFYSVS